MWRCIYLNILIFTVITGVFAQAPWQKDLKKRNRQERYKITVLDNSTIKMKHIMSGLEKYLDISDHHFDPATNLESMQFFDLINADTNLYNYKYSYMDKILVAGGLGYPLVIGDFNNNSLLDFSGIYKIEQDLKIGECAIVEINPDSSFSLRKIYPDSVVTPLVTTDLDKDGLIEINHRKAGGQWFYNYESVDNNSYPDLLNFKYRMWYISGAVGSETFIDLDKDNITDVLYVADDTLDPHGQKIYVAEFYQSINNFELKYRFPPPEWRVSGFSVGDFDNDGFKEFVTGSIDGDVYIFENTGDNSYAFIFADTISTPNAYLTCSTNDIDNNGKIEFFVGGSSYYQGIGGTKVYWFEADGNNSYQKIFTFFLWGTDVLGTTEMYSYDVNADNIDDLVFAFGGAVVILIWNQSGFFDLHYLDWLENWNQEIQSVNIYDLFYSGKPDLLVSIEDIETLPRVRTNIYLNNFITGIYDPKRNITEFKLNQNYPNPLNSNTTISFSINIPEIVTLTIYDISGKEVIKLYEAHFINPGFHSISWNGKNNYGKEVSSGIYFYQLRTDSFLQTKKMLLIR